VPARTRSGSARIGVHPFASQDCRKWPAASWIDLVTQLLDAGLEVTAFGSGIDRPALDEMFGIFGNRVRIVTTGIPDFARELAGLDLLVGLDSFSVHMAENVGTPSVMLNGANNPVLYAPPHAKVMSSSGGCAAWPCYNKPTCIGGPAEYVCIRSIAVQRVRDAVLATSFDAREADAPTSVH
jgi:heptosyltransferase-3